MTIDEIRERDAEIKDRLTAITAELDGDLTDEEIDARRAEVGSLQTELTEHRKEELKLMASVTELEPVIKENKKEERKEIIMTNRKSAQYSTEEYRMAFMNYVLNGDASYFRAEDATITTKVPDVIVPPTITAKLYKIDPNAGQVYGLVTKTAYPAGMVLPVGTFKPELQWVAERAIANPTTASTESIIFVAYKGQIIAPISLEVSVMTLAEFETMIIAKINEAVAKGFDKVIISGKGKTLNQPEGILEKETEVDSDKVYTMTNIDSYDEWLEAYKRVPVAERAGLRLFINRADMLGHLYTTKDSTGKVAVINTVDKAGFFGYSFMGVPIVELEDCGLDDSSAGGVFAFFFNPADYYLNINKQPTMTSYIDQTTDDIVTKMTLLADGKVVDTDSLVFIKAPLTTSKKSA